MRTPEQLREMALKGGEAMKKKAAADPTYYSRIGRLGGFSGTGKKKPRRKKPATAPAATRTPKPPVAQREPVAPQPRSVDVLDAILGGL